MPLKNEAIAVFQGTVKGSVHFIEENGVVKIELNLTGLKKKWVPRFPCP
jgi:hypothetical protein